jgi:hypothetical protein
MANFEQRKSTGSSSKGTSRSSARDMYNWYPLLRPLVYCEGVFEVCSVDDKGEKETISNCEFTIENVHYRLLLRLNKQEQKIVPLKRIEIWAADKCIEVLDLDKTQEGVTHFLVTNLDKLAEHCINKIIFIPEEGHNLELTRK